MEPEVEVSAAPMGKAAASTVALVALATEVGGVALAMPAVALGVPLLVSCLVSLWSSLSLVVPLVSVDPSLLTIGGVEVVPASSRVICFEIGFGEWMLSLIPPDVAMVSSTLPGDIMPALGE